MEAAAISAPIRFGQIVLDRSPEVTVPAAVEVPSDSPLVLRFATEDRPAMAGVVESFVLRSLAVLPAGLVRCRFVDPVGAGSSVERFMVLAESGQQLVGSAVATDSRDIDTLVSEMGKRVEYVSRTVLRGVHSSLAEFNAQADQPEPYHLLVVLDFPAQFSAATAERLFTLARTGGRCGVFVLLTVDEKRELPHGFDRTSVEELSPVVDIGSQGTTWRLTADLCPEVDLDGPPPSPLFSQILDRIGADASSAASASVSFDRVALPSARWWEEDAADGLVANIGIADNGSIAQLRVDSSPRAHIAIAGKIGSGKTNVLHTLICSLAMRYSPRELELYLIDLKSGVGFAPYAAHRLPHAKVVAIGNEREYALSVLRAIEAEFGTRGRALRASRMHQDAPALSYPRIVLVMDEFQELLGGEDSVATQAARCLDQLVRKGREFGIHVVLATQSLSGSGKLALATVGQIAIRIALECNETDSTFILGERNTAARDLRRPGEAIINEENGRPEGNRHVQFAHLPIDRLHETLSAMRDKADDDGFGHSVPVVFVGDEIPQLDENADFASALDGSTGGHPIRIMLGDPVAFAPPLSVALGSRSGNAAIVGVDEEAATGLLAAAALSAIAQGSIERDLRVVIIGDPDPSLPNAGSYRALAEALPALVELRHASQLDETMAGLVEERTGAGGSEGTALLILHGLQRLGLPPLDGEFSNPDPESVAGQLTRLLRIGGAHRLHTLLWCESWPVLKASIPRSGQEAIGLRIGLFMPADDSSSFLGSRDASSIGVNRAILRDGTTGRSTRFRPYPEPPPDLVADVARVRAKPMTGA